MLHTRPIVLSLTLSLIVLGVSAAPISAQSSSTSALSTVAPAPSPKSSVGSWGSDVQPPRYRTVVSLYWHNTPPVVFPRRTVASPVVYLPTTRTTTPPVVLHPTIPFQTKQTGLSTAMPRWKVASSVLQATSHPTTGHSTYTAPAFVNAYDVIVPRRRFSYGISFVKTY